MSRPGWKVPGDRSRSAHLPDSVFRVARIVGVAGRALRRLHRSAPRLGHGHRGRRGSPQTPPGSVFGNGGGGRGGGGAGGELRRPCPFRPSPSGCHRDQGLHVDLGNPDDPTEAAIAKLEAAGIRSGYADYWVAYKLDFLSRRQLQVGTTGYDDDRSASIQAAVRRSTRVSWFFVPPSEADIKGTQFTAPWLVVGPDTVSEPRFERTLRRLGVRFRVIDTGIVQAVIPNRSITPYQAGMPGVPPPPNQINRQRHRHCCLNSCPVFRDVTGLLRFGTPVGKCQSNGATR